jgi:hypothetical protein
MDRGFKMNKKELRKKAIKRISEFRCVSLPVAVSIYNALPGKVQRHLRNKQKPLVSAQR